MTTSHDSLLNHVMSSRCCFPPSDRYCAVGRELWMDYQAECVAKGGRDAMLTVRHQSPEWADEIKRRALILINGEARRAA